MSKIFDVIKKTDLLDLEDISTRSVRLEEAPVPERNRGDQTLRDFSRPELPSRVVPLRLSALDPIFPFEEEHSTAAEQYRIIRTRILHHPKKPKVLVITSASSGDGKTVTSINLAAALALKRDGPILLIDGDLRRPKVGEMLGLPPEIGLSEVLSGRTTLDDAVVRTEELPNLWILSAGSGIENPAELLDSQRWRSLIEEVRSRFSYVIIDATPVAAVADYDLVQVVSDGVIIVARPDHTERKHCLEVISAVPKEKSLGLILNCVENWFLWKTPSYGYYKRGNSAVNTERISARGHTSRL
jgi:capsular exopolysaccharide synthesis family protein